MAVVKKLDLPSFTRLSVDQMIKKMNTLHSDRSNWEVHWQDVADHILPRKNTIIRKSADGNKRQFILLDNVGMHSNELLAGALHGLLTNPNALWFELTSGDPELDMDDEVRAWMQKSVRQMHNVLNNSNFQMEIHELYIDLCAFGTACMFMEEDDKTVIRFSTKFIADFGIEENNEGVVDENWREFQWTAQQIVAEYGLEGLPDAVKKSYEKNDQRKFTMYHAVYPWSTAGVEKSERPGMQYISQHVLKDYKVELKAGLFAEFPYVIPRWGKASGEKYGRSPGMNALPELKILNEMNKTMLIGAQKMVDPPLQMEDDGVILPLITRPGGINFRRPGSPEIKPVFNDTRIDFGYQAVEDRRKRVRDTYFIDQLQLQAPGGPMMTATEVLQRTEEKMRLLGPMLGRQQSELLRPLINRLFNIMFRRKMIDPPPQQIQGKNLDVRYSSLIAKSQRLDEGMAVQRFIQAAMPFLQLDPTCKDVIKGDGVLRVLAQVFAYPQEGLASQKEIAKIRQDRQQMVNQQAQAQQQAQSADTMQTSTQAMVNMGKANPAGTGQ